MDNNENCRKTSINWYPGHMAKTKKEIAEDLKLVNLVIEIIDARIPMSSRNPDIDLIVKDKKRIILLNKSDLAEEAETAKWVKTFKNKNISVVKTNFNLNIGIKDVINLIQEMTQEEREKAKKRGIVNKKIRIMVLGIPNVGKSSFINKITKKTSANTGNKPGVTKQKQWISLNNNIELLDTPGVLWPKLNGDCGLKLAYIGTIKDDILSKTEIAFELLKYLYTNYFNNICNRYKISEEEIILKDELNNSILELMNLIGKKRGAIVLGGNVDIEKVSNIILDDFRTGKIGKITLEKVNEI